ncbi:unnamed protein product, partial [Ascophyllum nodosum]
EGLPSHLIVLVHGLAGTPEDLTYLKQGLEHRSGDGEVLVHLARCNKGKTKDGVAEGGSRLADEIRQVVKSNPSLTRISLVGNSLGGLYVRYAAKLLYHEGKPAPAGETPRGTVAGLEPSVFMTIAAPHLGVRSFTFVPVPSSLHPLSGVIVGKTGSDLFMRSSNSKSSNSKSSSNSESRSISTKMFSGWSAKSGTAENVDVKSGRSSLLYDMATAEEYLTPLRAFRRRRAYANRRGDFMVPYGTAAFVGPDEEDGGNLTDGLSTFDRVWGAKEGTIIGMSRIPPASSAGSEKWGRRSGISSNANKKGVEEEMAAGLNSCGWEKVAVDFGGVVPVSHNKICALSRSPLTTALFRSGNKIMDHAADFLVAQDF